MYEFILWMCLATQPECPVWNAYGNFVLIFPTKDRADCEAAWKESLAKPDPDGKKSRYICQPITEPL